MNQPEYLIVEAPVEKVQQYRELLAKRDARVQAIAEAKAKHAELSVQQDG